MNNKISNVRFEQITSIRKGYNEVRASFVLNGKEGTYFIFTESKNAINEAKKIFYKDLKAGLVAKSVRRFPNVQHPILVSACALLGAAVIALGSVLIYKAVVGQQGLAQKYLNNPTKITTYTDDKLRSEQTITYNNAWYRTASIAKTYNPNTGEIDSTTEENYKLDNKNRVIEGERVFKDASGEILEKNIQKSTFETDNKGTEYVENQYIEDGVVVEVSSYYDEYETTYSVEGERQVDSGEDCHYVDGKLVERKTRTSDGVIANKGYDAPSKSEGKKYKYDEEGNETLIGEYYSETERTAKSRTTWDNDFKKYDYSKELEDSEWVERENLVIGFAECTEDRQVIYEEFYNYTDKEAEQLESGTKRMYGYDNFNRETTNIVYELDVESEEEKWDMTNIVSRSYHTNNNEPSIINRSTYEEGLLDGTSDTYQELDKYGRVVYQVAYNTRIKHSGERETTKNVTKYEYGDPVPLDPSRDEDLYY